MESSEFVPALARMLGGAQAFATAERVANAYSSLEELAKANPEEIVARADITQSDAERTAAAIELTRHFFGVAESSVSTKNSEQLFKIFAPLLANRQQEHLAVCVLNSKNQPIKTEVVYKGTQNSMSVRISELFKLAITCNASAVAFAHNHPSGDPKESEEDIDTTRALVEAGDLLNIRVLDHLIIGNAYAYGSIRANHPDIWASS